MMKSTAKREETCAWAADRLFNFRPIFFCAVFLCLGIVFAYGHLLLDASAWWLLCFLPLFAFPLLFLKDTKKMKKTVLAVLLLGVSFSIGGFAFYNQLSNFQSAPVYEGETYVVGKTVAMRKSGDYCVVSLEDFVIGGNAVDGQIIAYLPASFYGNIHLADKLMLRGNVTTNLDFFGYYGFRAGDIDEGVRYTIWVEESDSTAAIQNVSVIGCSSDVFLLAKKRIQESVYAGMDDTPAAVTMAVLTGDRTGIEKGLYDNIRAGGVAHIFAVSGLHIGAMFGFCMLILEGGDRKRGGRASRFIITSAVLIGYAGVCGFSPSVLRATVICLVSYAAKLTGLTVDFLQAIGASAIIVLCISPVTLMEAGFQLSFLACLGLALLTRPLRLAMESACCKVRSWFPKTLSPAEIRAIKNDDTLPASLSERIRRSVISFLSASLATQIFTAPLLMSLYGYLSGWSLLLNCLFIPVISVGFSFVLLLVLLVCILPEACAAVLLYLPNVIWSALLLLFETIDFSTFALTGLKLSLGSYVSYYGGCVFATDKWNVTPRLRRVLTIACVFAFAVTMFVTNL